MGGNALSVTAVRLTKSNFQQVERDCVARLMTALPESRVAAIPAYGSKSDFGDLDILVSATGYDIDRAAAALGAVEVVRNGPTTSIGIVVREHLGAVAGNVFQVDLIESTEEAFDFAYAYSSFNDLGNLIGRTAHRAGLVHRHDGLYYYLRDGTKKFGEICLTRDYDEALRFLGYDAARFHAGFDNLEEIFQYVAGSAYFNRDIFLLENRNAKSRIRDRKRHTYMTFLTWCEARPDLPAFEYPDDKAVWLPRIAEHFPGFDAEYQAALASQTQLNAARARFNGEWVALVTGLADKPLGILMKHLRESFDSPAALHQFVLASTDAELIGRVLAMQEKLAADPETGITPPLDNYEQWHAWRIGRDSRHEGASEKQAVQRLQSVFPQYTQRAYFDAGFAGQACPKLTAPNPA
jgi:hypothetical protein